MPSTIENFIAFSLLRIDHHTRRLRLRPSLSDTVASFFLFRSNFFIIFGVVKRVKRTLECDVISSMLSTLLSL